MARSEVYCKKYLCFSARSACCVRRLCCVQQQEQVVACVFFIFVAACVRMLLFHVFNLGLESKGELLGP
jgi:hypothetical protein